MGRDPLVGRQILCKTIFVEKNNYYLLKNVRNGSTYQIIVPNSAPCEIVREMLTTKRELIHSTYDHSQHTNETFEDAEEFRTPMVAFRNKTSNTH